MLTQHILGPITVTALAMAARG